MAAALSEYAKNAPPIDFSASFDSLDIMEQVMRHFYQRALIEQRMGAAGRLERGRCSDAKTLAAAEKVARYRHAQLSAVRLAGDIKRQDGRRQPRRASGHDQAGVGQARPTDRPGP